jgi:hypothetical protein
MRRSYALRAIQRPSRWLFRSRKPLLTLLAAVALLLTAVPSLRAADASAVIERMEEPGHRPHYLVVVFDVSGSMRDRAILSRARQQVLTLVNEGLKEGDRMALIHFASRPTVAVDLEVKRDADRRALREAVPTSEDIDPGRGSNIRWAQHQALELVREYQREHPGMPPRGASIVLVSDSFNDQPEREGEGWERYLDYYSRQSLSTYPNTKANREYEELLRAAPERRIQVFGFGLEIDSATRRPVEQAPQAIPIPKPTEPPPAPATTAAPPKRDPPWLLIIGSILAATVVLGAVMLTRPGAASLTDGKTTRNFTLPGGRGVQIGGAGAAQYDYGFPVVGTKDPLATIRHSMGRYTLFPSAAASGQVLVNGQPATGATPLRFGDEIKLIVAGAGGTRREVRLTFGRPVKEEPRY